MPGLRYRTAAHQLWALVVECLTMSQARMAAAAADVGLSPVSALTLIRLDPAVPISQKQLAERMHCSPSTVVDPTDRLEQRGLVARHTHRDDRRVKVLVVTDEGRRVRDRLVSELFAPPESLERLSAADQARFRDAMLEAVSPSFKREPR